MKRRAMRSAIGAVGMWLVVTASVAACGGGTATIGGTGGSCANVSPCGGNVVGTWNIANFCATGSSSSAAPPVGCSAQREQFNVVGISGTLTFNADGTYSETTTVTESVVLSVAMNCMADGAAVSCSQLGQTETSAADGAAVSCVANGSNCDCTLPPRTATLSGTGMYSTSGTLLTITPPSGSGSTSQYCVQGNTLSLVSTTMGMDAGTESASATFVLTRQ